MLNNPEFRQEKLNAAGVATHFIERISDTRNSKLNKKVKIIHMEVCFFVT